MKWLKAKDTLRALDICAPTLMAWRRAGIITCKRSDDEWNFLYDVDSVPKGATKKQVMDKFGIPTHTLAYWRKAGIIKYTAITPTHVVYDIDSVKLDSVTSAIPKGKVGRPRGKAPVKVAALHCNYDSTTLSHINSFLVDVGAFKMDRPYAVLANGPRDYVLKIGDVPHSIGNGSWIVCEDGKIQVMTSDEYIEKHGCAYDTKPKASSAGHPLDLCALRYDKKTVSVDHINAFLKKVGQYDKDTKFAQIELPTDHSVGVLVYGGSRYMLEDGTWIIWDGSVGKLETSSDVNFLMKYVVDPNHHDIELTAMPSIHKQTVATFKCV